jgi:hypothetical protein
MSLPQHSSFSTPRRITVDHIAIAIGLVLAALIRFNILPSISF